MYDTLGVFLFFLYLKFSDANFVDYVELNCYGVSTCSASVDGGDGKSAVLSLYASRSNETLVDIKMDPVCL